MSNAHSPQARSGYPYFVAEPCDALPHLEHAHDAVLPFDIVGLGSDPFDRLRHLNCLVEGSTAARSR